MEAEYVSTLALGNSVSSVFFASSSGPALRETMQIRDIPAAAKEREISRPMPVAADYVSCTSLLERVCMGHLPPPVMSKVLPSPLKLETEGSIRGYVSLWYVLTGLGKFKSVSLGNFGVDCEASSDMIV